MGNAIKNTIIINSLSQYIKYIESNFNNRFALFRGQSLDRPLLPKIGRLNLRYDFKVTEKKMFRDFKLFSLPYLSVEPFSEWDWLAIAQHHGLATRLLDWTENPLIALWFVVKHSPHKDDFNMYEDGVVWVFIPQDSHFVNDTDVDPFTIKKTKVFQPKHIARRISAQSGWFTVHKYIEKNKKFIKMEVNKEYKNHLTKLIIPGESFADIRNSLDKCNINSLSVFPDLDGLCSLIEWRNTYFEDEGYVNLGAETIAAALDEE